MKDRLRRNHKPIIEENHGDYNYEDSVDKIFDTMLDEAAKIAINDMFVEMPADAALECRLPESLQCKLDDLITKESRKDVKKRRLRSSSKAAVFFVCFGLTFSILTMSVPALKLAFHSVYMEVRGDQIYLRLDRIPEADLPEDCYYPAYVPEGYYLYKIEGTEGNYTLIYRNLDNNTIYFYQVNTQAELFLDLEDATLEQIVRNDRIILKSNKHNSGRLIWECNGYGFVLHGWDVSEKVLLDMLDSVEPE